MDAILNIDRTAMHTAVCSALLLIGLISPSHVARGQQVEIPGFVEREFTFSEGNYQLDGRLLLPDTLGRHPVILNIWGSGPTRMEHVIENSEILSMFTEKGYAVLLYDKPGSGASSGRLSEKQLFHDRARIARAALDKLKKSRHVNPERIGLYGSSQAAYVMSLLLENQQDLSFVVCWSCPMENSINQTAYQIQEFLLCAGRDRKMAEHAGRAYINSRLAMDYGAYLQYAALLNQISEVRDELGWGGIAPREAWKPLDRDSGEFLDPARAFRQVSIPVLALYGTLDKNIDPHQAVGFLESQQNEHLQTAWIPGADHNMMTGGTGCVQEQINGYKTVPNSRRSQAFKNTLTSWIQKLH